MCATNALLCYSRHWELDSLEYEKADFNIDLIEELLQEADRLRGVVHAPTEDHASLGQGVPDCFAGHGWAPPDPDRAKVRQCVVCKERANCMCLCGEMVCGPKTGRQSIFTHMHDVLQQGPGARPQCRQEAPPYSLAETSLAPLECMMCAGVIWSVVPPLQCATVSLPTQNMWATGKVPT